MTRPPVNRLGNEKRRPPEPRRPGRAAMSQLTLMAARAGRTRYGRGPGGPRR